MDHDKRLLEVTGPGRIDGFNWGDVQPYVMFITGRCGSTWLAKLLQATGVAGHPREWLNSEVAAWAYVPAETLPEYFGNIVEKYAGGGRFGLQVDPERLRDLAGIVDWANVVKPSIPSFFMYRRDLVAQAWSWLQAEHSGVWHVGEKTDGDTDEMPRGDYVPTFREMVDQIVELRRQEEQFFAFWNEHGYKPHFIAYESLATDPGLTVASVLSELGVPDESIRDSVQATSEVRSTQMAYDNRAAWMVEFARLNQEPLAALDRDRFGVSSEYLDQHLLAVEPLVWPYMMGADSLAAPFA